jgi:hypothetical protein
MNEIEHPGITRVNRNGYDTGLKRLREIEEEDEKEREEGSDSDD